ncbi:sugar O-acyltransferase, sialic acid O-acetyltransferase NeuD family [Lachnospiraceae bacterium C10]|nr:sugar O-acyltransferase, sialic acid O-acetyltransferase NeuD family [Lachnospiraceae bacterium C10]
MKSILIIGAGGHGQVVAECAEACGYEKINFLDDYHPDAVGVIDQLEAAATNYDGVIVSIGNNEIRRKLITRLQNINAPLMSLIHPRAYVSPTVAIGPGSIVLPGAVIHTNVHIGIGCIVSIGALVDHDAIVEDFSHINTGAIVGAGKRANGKVEAGQVVK